MKKFKGIFSLITICILFTVSQNASALAYTFIQDGYSEGATVTGTFEGVDTDMDGQLVHGGGFSELTDFTMMFSGTSIVPAFSLDITDLWGFVYDIGSSFLGDGLTGLIEGIGAESLTSFNSYESGQGPLGRDGGEVIAPTGAVDISNNLVVVTQVPEPTTLALIGFGLVGIGWKRRKAV